MRRDKGSTGEAGSFLFYDRQSMLHYPGWTVAEDEGNQDNNTSSVTVGEELDGGTSKRTTFWKQLNLSTEEGRTTIFNLRAAVPQGFSSWGANGIILKHKLDISGGGGSDTAVITIQAFDTTTASDTSAATASRTVAGTASADTNYQDLQLSGSTLNGISNVFTAGSLIHLRITLSGAYASDYPSFWLGKISAYYE